MNSPVPLCILLLLQSHFSYSRRLWTKRHLRWALRDPFNLISPSSLPIIRRILDESLTMWAESAGNGRLSFEEVFPPLSSSIHRPEGIDIDVLFARRNHGDKDPFDGRGGIVAHAQYPPKGELHLDADELWNLGGGGGVDLRQVILHEIGHILGLRHSKSEESIMNPYYAQRRKALFIPMVDEYNLRLLYH